MNILFNARDVCLALGVYSQKGIDTLIRRKVREYIGLEFDDFVESAASEYSKNFKPMAIADFEMEIFAYRHLLRRPLLFTSIRSIWGIKSGSGSL